jgi:YD repeat-containing protein
MTNYEYDLAGRLKKIIYADTNFVLFTYDLAGRAERIRIRAVTKPLLLTRSGLPLGSETNADAKVTSYTYDLMSNLTGMTDALNRTTNYTYDESLTGSLKIKYPEATAGAGRLEENFTYDSAGNLLQRRIRTPE